MPETGPEIIRTPRVGGMRKVFGVLALSGLAGTGLGAGLAHNGGQEGAGPSEVADFMDEAQNILFDGTNGQGVEAAYHIAGMGSCSPFTRADGRAVASGEFHPTEDMTDVEVSFLRQNDTFATNFAVTSENKLAPLYEAFDIARPSVNNADDGETLADVFNNEYFVTAPLARQVTVQNTYCDDEGNLHDYRVVHLEEGTYVGGVLITRQFEEGGVLKTELANGNVVVLPENALVAEVELADGSTSLMYATNKGGVNADGDFESEVSCFNVITSVPPEVTPPTTSTSTTTSTSQPPSSTTSTSSTTTTTTRPTPTTTPDKNPVPLPPRDNEPGEPGAGGEPEIDNTPDDSNEDGYDEDDRSEHPVDTDGDGLYDEVDNCDNSPETRNGYQDGDGCPDTLPPAEDGSTPTTGNTTSTTQPPQQGNTPPTTAPESSPPPPGD